MRLGLAERRGISHTAPALIGTLGGNVMVLGYLDPAAGGMIVQTIIAAAIALPFILRSHISRAMARFRGDRAENSDKPSLDQ